MPVSERYTPAPRHSDLGEGYFDTVEPARFPEHRLRFRNQRWAERVGLDTLSDEEWLAHLARFEPLPDNLPEPLALRYHGHQFDSYNPALGDGRGFLFAQLRDAEDGRLLDLGTKGSGRTPYSRGGDGRLTLKGGVREVLATEMLEALGVYTSKTFSVVETGEKLDRGDEPSPTRACVLVRLSHSHVRIGTFQRLAYEGDTDRIRRLVEYSAEHYLPSVQGHEDLPAMFLREVCRRSAELTASWMVAGFVHGVLNSDNMVITGESFDYGPWRFLPRYDPDFTAAYFDHTGLYAYGRQPRAVFKNLSRLAQTLRGSSSDEALERALDGFIDTFNRARVSGVLRRLGVESVGPDEDELLLNATYDFLAKSELGPERFFFDWFAGATSEKRALAGPRSGDYAGTLFDAFRRALDAHQPSDPSRLGHEYFQRDEPVSLVVEEVESLWARIAEDDDWAALEEKVAWIREMGEAAGLARR